MNTRKTFALNTMLGTLLMAAATTWAALPTVTGTLGLITV